MDDLWLFEISGRPKSLLEFLFVSKIVYSGTSGRIARPPQDRRFP